jgi:hypothetical protein
MRALWGRASAGRAGRDNRAMFRPTLSIPLLASLFGVACSPTLDWRELRPEGSGIAAMFPCKPDRHARPLRVAGHPVRMEMLVCSAGGATYALAFADLPDPAAVPVALQELRELAGTNIAAAPVPPLRLQVPGMTPYPQAARVSLSGRLPDGAAVQEQAVFFAKGLRVYQASVIGERPSAEAADTFLAGLRLPA